MSLMSRGPPELQSSRGAHAPGCRARARRRRSLAPAAVWCHALDTGAPAALSSFPHPKRRNVSNVARQWAAPSGVGKPWARAYGFPRRPSVGGDCAGPTLRRGPPQPTPLDGRPPCLLLARAQKRRGAALVAGGPPRTQEGGIIPPPPLGSVAAATFFPSSLQKCVSKAAAAFEAAKAALTVGGTRPPPISERDTWGECSEGGAVGVVRAAHRTHGSPFLYAHTRDA